MIEYCAAFKTPDQDEFSVSVDGGWVKLAFARQNPIVLSTKQLASLLAWSLDAPPATARTVRPAMVQR